MIAKTLFEGNQAVLKMWLFKNPMVVLWNDCAECWLSQTGDMVSALEDALCIRFGKLFDGSTKHEWTHLIEVDMKLMGRYRSAVKYADKLRNDLLTEWRKMSPTGEKIDE